MTGFEVAGIVLGVIPLVISALEHYKSGKSSAAAFVKYHGLLDVLILRLKNQRTLFYLNIMILLKAAGVDDLTDHQEHDCMKVLMDSDSASKIKLYLDFAYGTFEDIIREYERCLKLIVSKLSNINRTPQAPKDDLHAVLTANTPQQGKFAFRQRLHFTLERGSLRKLVEDLKEDTLSLEAVVKGMRTMHEFEPSSPSGVAVKLAKKFQRIQRFARSLYTAVSTGWTSDCHSKHNIMIHLEDRLTSLHVKQKTLNRSHDPVSFDLFLTPDDCVPTDAQVWQQAVVHALEDENESLSSASRSGILKPKVNIIAPNDLASSLHRSKLNRVTDMCNVINQALVENRSLSLHLLTNILYVPEETVKAVNWNPPINSTPPMTLDRFLAETSRHEDSHLAYKERTILALRLASSILQLNSTQWFTGPWTKSAIYFFSGTAATCKIDANRPTIMQTFENPACSSAPHDTGPDPKTALLELGVLLLEIWHHKSLDMWASERSEAYSDTGDGRRTAAIRWLETTQSKLPLNHLRAIEACLQFSAGRLRGWDENDFRKQVCEDIVQPLLQNCKVW